MPNLPQRLLTVLTDQPQSLQDLSVQVGGAVPAVQAALEELSAGGVPIRGAELGYALAPGTPAPQLVSGTGELGQLMRYAGTVDSTQDEIRRWADNAAYPAPHGATFVAERQTAGRGRRGRVWNTTHGTLSFSMLLLGQGGALTLPYLSTLPLAIGVALREATGVGGLKWPNDLLAPDGRKLAGILLEADLRGEQARRAVLGIGINVTSAPDGAAHLSEYEAGMTRAEVLGKVLSALDYWLAQPTAATLQAWRSYTVMLGQPVQVQTASGLLVGTALDLDEQGNLLLRTLAGELHTVRGGDVQLIGSL